jgi:hypothetical protein
LVCLSEGKLHGRPTIRKKVRGGEKERMLSCADNMRSVFRPWAQHGPLLTDDDLTFGVPLKRVGF